MLSLYISSPTWLHRVRPGFKLVALAAASVVLLPTNDVDLLGASCLAFTAGFVSLGPPGRRRLWGLAKTAGLLALLIGVFQFVFSYSELGLVDAGRVALVSALRLLSLILLADLVSVTTPTAAMLNAIRRFLRPLENMGLSVQKLAVGVGLVIRMAGLLRERLTLVTQAIQARTGKRSGVKAVAPLIRQLGPLNRQLAEALYARQLRGRPPHQQTTRQTASRRNQSQANLPRP
jgi:biotin transport system permease protein